jgi:hypothetical protein
MDWIDVQPNVVLAAVVRSINPIADGLPIYGERMLQDYTTPCIFAIETGVTEVDELWPTLISDHKIEVTVLPDKSRLTPRRSASEWRKSLMDSLFKIDIDSLEDEEEIITRRQIFARNPECRIIENRPVYYATYRIRNWREQPEYDKMQTLVQNRSIKGDHL